MDNTIFHEFETNRQYTADRLDGISSGVSLFMVSDEIRFLYFNRAADEMFGYEKGGLLTLTDEDSLCIFHPDYVDHLYLEIISTMRDNRLFHYDCRILCRDGTYQWTNLSAQLVQQKEGGKLYFYCVLSPISAPQDTLIRGSHFLIAAGQEMDRQILCEQIEKMGGTCELTENGPDALELFSSSDEGRFDGFFIGSKMLGMNGFELAKEVRYSALPDGKTIPLILLVSDEDRENAENIRDLRIDAFLRKPIRRSDLFALLVHLTKK